MSWSQGFIRGFLIMGITSIRDGVFYLALSPALLGLVVHLLWSALWGLIFGLLARRLHLR